MSMTFEGTTTRVRLARTGRARRLFVVLAAVVAVASFSTVLSSCESTSGERWQVAALVNQSRVQAGLRQLKSNLTLDIKADNWAQKMRNACQISHSRLADGAPSNWRKLGENVGEGATIQVVHGDKRAGYQDVLRRVVGLYPPEVLASKPSGLN